MGGEWLLKILKSNSILLKLCQNVVQVFFYILDMSKALKTFDEISIFKCDHAKTANIEVLNVL